MRRLEPFRIMAWFVFIMAMAIAGLYLLPEGTVVAGKIGRPNIIVLRNGPIGVKIKNFPPTYQVVPDSDVIMIGDSSVLFWPVKCHKIWEAGLPVEPFTDDLIESITNHPDSMNNAKFVIISYGIGFDKYGLERQKSAAIWEIIKATENSFDWSSDEMLIIDSTKMFKLAQSIDTGMGDGVHMNEKGYQVIMDLYGMNDLLK